MGHQSNHKREEDDSIILNKEGTTIVFPEEGYYPLCIKDEDNILVLRPIVDLFQNRKNKGISA